MRFKTSVAGTPFARRDAETDLGKEGSAKEGAVQASVLAWGTLSSWVERQTHRAPSLHVLQERLDDYYRRNFREYFQFEAG